MTEEPINFEASGRYIFKKNLELTLQALIKTLQAIRDDVPFDFDITIQQKEEA